MPLLFEIKIYSFTFLSYFVVGFLLVMISRFLLKKYWKISKRRAAYCALGSSCVGTICAFVLFQFDEGVNSGGSGLGAVAFALGVYAIGAIVGALTLIISVLRAGTRGKQQNSLSDQ